MSKAAIGIPLEQHMDLAMGTQHVLAEDAGIQQVSTGAAEEPFHHVDLEGTDSDSARKSDVVKPVVLLI